jgi:predicted aconitase
VLFTLTGFPPSLEPTDSLYVAVGLIVGAASRERVPVIDGLPPPASEDPLKALGAAAASSGSVALFHAVGITPEAPTRDAAFGGTPPLESIQIIPEDVTRALRRLSRVPEGTALTAVCLGTPHFSRIEWQRLLQVLREPAVGTPSIPIYVNTDRDTLRALEHDGLLEELRRCHVIVVTDTCTYLTPILERMDGAVMTNSGKWAHYAPGNLGVEVAFGELEDCVASSVAGHVVRVRR